MNSARLHRRDKNFGIPNESADERGRMAVISRRNFLATFGIGTMVFGHLRAAAALKWPKTIVPIPKVARKFRRLITAILPRSSALSFGMPKFLSRRWSRALFIWPIRNALPPPSHDVTVGQ